MDMAKSWSIALQNNRFTETFDGTGRKAFPLQMEFLEWLPKQTARVIAGQLPTGTGKSFLVRTIQRATGGLACVASNMLIDQYAPIYPDVNILKGAAHYRCERNRMSCGEARELELGGCGNCQFDCAFKAAKAGEPTIFNPMSLYNLAGQSGFDRPKTTIVDEAHTLPGMLLLVAGEKFSASKFKLPKSTNSLEVLAWLADQIPKIRRLAESYAERQMGGQAVAALRDVLRLEAIFEGLEADPANYVIYRKTDTYNRRNDEFLHIRPLDPPKPLLDKVLGSGRIILLSATLSRIDAELLAPGEEVAYFDAESPIPVDQRRIFYRPMAVPANSKTDVNVIARYVAEILADNPGNALIHATYAMASRLSAALNAIGIKAFANTADTKNACISRFKKDGGVFVAAGCAEGLDLPDDECRVNIIPVLPRMDPTEPSIQKWLALPGGRRRYALETLRTVQQQAGRSTRHVLDHSKVFIGDDQFPSMIGRVKADLSKSFLDAIVWTKG